MMGFQPGCRSAQFTFLRQKTLDNFTPLTPDRFDRLAYRTPFAPLQWNTSEVCDKRFLVRSPFYPDFQHVVRAIFVRQFGLEPLVDLPTTRFEFVRQGLHQGDFHDAFEFAELMQVVGEVIILDDSPVFRLILGDDTVCCIVDELGSVDWFAFSQVP